MGELQEKITSPSSTTEDKNAAFEELQILNLTKGKETYLENKILSDFKIKSFVEIDHNDIKVTITSSEHNTKIANDIMKCIQNEFNDKKNIVVKFES